MTAPQDSTGPTAPEPGSAATAFLVYSVARLGLFLALWAVAFFVGLPALPAAVVAAVVSLPVSWFLLAPQRARLTQRMVDSRESRRVIDPDHRG